MSEAAQYLLSQGGWGVVVLGLVFWILRKDAAHTTEVEKLRAARDVEVASMRTACDLEKKALLDAFIGEKNFRITDAQGYAGLTRENMRDVLSYVSEAKSADAKIAEQLAAHSVKVAELSKSVDEVTAWTINERRPPPRGPS